MYDKYAGLAKELRRAGLRNKIFNEYCNQDNIQDIDDAGKLTAVNLPNVVPIICFYIMTNNVFKYFI